jgi:hypothetical protein
MFPDGAEYKKNPGPTRTGTGNDRILIQRDDLLEVTTVCPSTKLTIAINSSRYAVCGILL